MSRQPKSNSSRLTAVFNVARKSAQCVHCSTSKDVEAIEIEFLFSLSHCKVATATCTLYKLCALSVRQIPIPDEAHSHSHPHLEWGHTSPGVMICLTENEDVPHRECTSSSEMEMCFTACASLGMGT